MTALPWAESGAGKGGLARARRTNEDNKREFGDGECHEESCTEMKSGTREEWI